MNNHFEKSTNMYSANKKLYFELEEKAREMRKYPTNAESILWEALKEKKLGVKFRRQHIINRFIVDFFCFNKDLVIELDGKIHNDQKDRDQERDEILKSLGCTIIRFKNSEVMNNIKQVLNKIKNELLKISS